VLFRLALKELFVINFIQKNNGQMQMRGLYKGGLVHPKIRYNPVYPLRRCSMTLTWKAIEELGTNFRQVCMKYDYAICFNDLLLYKVLIKRTSVRAL